MKSHVDMRKNMDMVTIFLCSVLHPTEVLFQYQERSNDSLMKSMSKQLWPSEKLAKDTVS